MHIILHMDIRIMLSTLCHNYGEVLRVAEIQSAAKFRKYKLSAKSLLYSKKILRGVQLRYLDVDAHRNTRTDSDLMHEFLCVAF